MPAVVPFHEQSFHVIQVHSCVSHRHISVVLQQVVDEGVVLLLLFRDNGSLVALLVFLFDLGLLDNGLLLARLPV
jgi:hypothetical protein